MQNTIPVYINYSQPRFNGMLEQFLQFLESVPFQTLHIKHKLNQPIAVVVSPRNNSGIPFCNLTLAMLYSAKGYPVTIIWDDLNFLDPEWNAQSEPIEKIINHITANSQIKNIKLSTLNPQAISQKDIPMIDKMAEANAIWNVRTVIPDEKLAEYKALSLETMLHNAPYIKALYLQEKFSFILHQSVINNNGPLHKYFANQQNQRLGVFDISMGRGLTGLDNVQGYFYDILHLINPESPHYIFADEQQRNLAIELAKQENALRNSGKDKRLTQPEANETVQTENYDIVIPLNILWDATALGRNLYFTSPYNWLMETVEWVLENTNLSIAIRQHPHEAKFAQYATGSRLGAALVEKFGSSERFRFIKAEEKVNTYHLIQNCQTVLPYTSTLGIEAGIMGKNVIVESDVYYNKQPFVTLARSKQDYFNKIKNPPKKAITQHEEEQAWLIYFIITNLIFVYSEFGLDPDDFKKWGPKGFQNLVNDKSINDALITLLENRPYAALFGREFLPKKLNENREYIPIEENSLAEIQAAILKINQKLYSEVSNMLTSKTTLEYRYLRAYCFAAAGNNKHAKMELEALLKEKTGHTHARLLLNEIN